MTTVIGQLPRGPICPVCASLIGDARFASGAWCCSRRCERVRDRLKAAEATGDGAKLARVRAVKQEILHESLNAAVARKAAREAEGPPVG